MRPRVVKRGVSDFESVDEGTDVSFVMFDKSHTVNILINAHAVINGPHHEKTNFCHM